MSERDTPILLILSWCRNMTLRSSTILVSERDTPILYYPGVGTWHSDPLLSWCRNVTLRSSTILVSERDTPILYYHGVGMWHSDPLLSWCRNVTLRSSTTLVSERDTRSINLILFNSSSLLLYQSIIINKEVLRFKSQQPHHANSSQLHNHIMQAHN